MEKTILKKFDRLQAVVNGLRYSQGFYSRLALQLDTLTDSDKLELEQQLPDFETDLDVIFYLEQ